MSYATSLLAAYPSSYGTTTLFSDNLVQGSSFDNIYRPSVGFGGTDRLFSDDLTFNQISHNPTTYHPPLYTISNSTSVFPKKNYENSPIVDYGKTSIPNDSYVSLNDIPEYSESLVTASNTNTASSVARSLYEMKTIGPMNKFPIQQQNYTHTTNDDNNHLPKKSIWSSTQQKTKAQPDDVKKKPALKQQQSLLNVGRAQPSTDTLKDSSNGKLNDDLTPVQSPKGPLPLAKQPNHLQRNATIVEIEKQPPSIDIQAWVNETKKESSPIDENEAQQAWSVKIGQLQMVQAQHEREKTKSLRVLPHPPKKIETKAIVNKKKPVADITPPDATHQHDSYFDSLFDGDYFRKPSTNSYSIGSSFRNSKAPKTKLINSLGNINLNAPSKTSKYSVQQKKTRYEPPTVKRVPPTITTTSWRKTWPKHYHFDSTYPYHLYNEFTHRDFIHKDTDERFREALQKLRADRAEQQQKEINEKTAKRLHYGDYVRHLTKDALMQNAVKPSPWSDFMDLKKGNLYSLSKEEKKELYNQSRSYGERVRYRNFAYNYESETARSYPHSAPLTDDSQGSDAGSLTPRQRINNNDVKSVSRTSKRPGSGSTTKTTNKNPSKLIGARIGNRPLPNQTNRTTVRTDRPNAHRPSENDDEDSLTYDTNRKYRQQPKKKNVHYAKNDPSRRSIISGDEDDGEINYYDPRSIHPTNREANDDLFTVREEKTLESVEAARYKKR